MAPQEIKAHFYYNQLGYLSASHAVSVSAN